MIKRKGMDVILILMKSRQVTVYTDGFSDSDCNTGGSGISFTYTTGSTAKNNESRVSPVGSVGLENGGLGLETRH